MWIQDELTCKPLDSYEEIISFIQNPPSWRTLCTDIKPHSQEMIKNMDINKNSGTSLLESPQSFCHFNPEAEDIQRHDKKNLPKTLVCHDMANGYHDDSYIDGTGQSDAYSFYNWAGIDVFCYFSHHLITIPPLGWINVGHAHGVQVIGTIITEWGAGAAFWDRALSSEREWRTLASALVAIAKTLKFDGWLLNVENKISRPAELVRFVRHLRALLRQELPAPLLLWYDSVTVDGHLQWQNGLNEKNKDFFEACDGIFTNYSWSEGDVRRSAAAAAAAGRLTDLYVGIDVWGRNFHGGGQFNTKQAVEVAHKHGCSLAIFAPAWTHEARGDSVIHGPALEPYDQFLVRDRALWGSLWPYLNTRLPIALPFQTAFCRGQGKKRRLYGEVIGPVAWYNLRHQQYQPNSALGPHGYALAPHKYTPKAELPAHAGTHRRSIEASVEVGSTKDDQEEKSQEDLKRLAYKDFVLKTPKTEADDESDTKEPAKDANLLKGSNGPAQESRSDSTGNEIPHSDKASEPVARDKWGRRRYSLAVVPRELECLEPFFEDSFMGGSCLKVNPRNSVSSPHRVARLFHCDFRSPRLVACVITKTMPGHGDQTLDVTLHVNDEGRRFTRVLVGHEVQEATDSEVSAPSYVFPLEGAAFRRVQAHVLLTEPAFYVPVRNDFGWKVRYYDVDIGSGRVTTVSCRARRPDGPVLLGYIGLCHYTDTP
ncbi:cytosolic endo-beta-N-acetylglucosaminidase [Aricia agestis]|uniref:cytosolic endo-beta-N-acetylglucosaminidase n=1 Tax=Aricia agestis TaxID=91739 RepID=UPI001C209251|nr:cytosolic endo-beta-N-acetylglucosaminidase [Aricia agestis]XP_041978109.1 cytosolic endo-beta-N-acetylglucosaminidase [Aricia agestis]